MVIWKNTTVCSTIFSILIWKFWKKIYNNVDVVWKKKKTHIEDWWYMTRLSCNVKGVMQLRLWALTWWKLLFGDLVCWPIRIHGSAFISWPIRRHGSNSHQHKFLSWSSHQQKYLTFQYKRRASLPSNTHSSSQAIIQPPHPIHWQEIPLPTHSPPPTIIINSPYISQ